VSGDATPQIGKADSADQRLVVGEINKLYLGDPPVSHIEPIERGRQLAQLRQAASSAPTARGNFASGRAGRPMPRIAALGDARRRALPPSETVPPGRERAGEKDLRCAPSLLRDHAASRSLTRSNSSSPPLSSRRASAARAQRATTRRSQHHRPFDAPDDFRLDRRSTVDQEMLRQLLNNGRGALESTSTAPPSLRLGAPLRFDGVTPPRAERLLAQRGHQLGRLSLAGAR